MVRTVNYDEKLRAVKLAESVFSLIKTERIKKGLAIDSLNDPYFSGLIGSFSSPITIGHKRLEEVILTTAPNFAGLFVSLLCREKIKAEETILVSLDGSLPGLYFSLLSACQVLAIRPFIVGSLTSHSWGANHPNFTYLDMEGLVFASGLLPFRTNFVSLGGEDDAGLGLSPFARDLLVAASERNGVPLLEGEDIGRKKLALCQKVSARVLFSLGHSPSSSVLGQEAKKKRMKVINFSHRIEKGITSFLISRSDLLTIGKGRIFEVERYSPGLAGLFVGIILLLLFIIIRYDIEYYLLSPKERIKEEEAI